MVVESADFLYLMTQTGLSFGNLSSHMSKLESAGFIKVDKEFVEKHCNFRIDVDEKTRDLFGKASSFDEYKEKMAEYSFEYTS